MIHCQLKAVARLLLLGTGSALLGILSFTQESLWEKLESTEDQLYYLSSCA